MVSLSRGPDHRSGHPEAHHTNEYWTVNNAWFIMGAVQVEKAMRELKNSAVCSELPSSAAERHSFRFVPDYKHIIREEGQMPATKKEHPRVFAVMIDHLSAPVEADIIDIPATIADMYGVPYGAEGTSVFSKL